MRIKPEFYDRYRRLQSLWGVDELHRTEDLS